MQPQAFSSVPLQNNKKIFPEASQNSSPFISLAKAPDCLAILTSWNAEGVGFLSSLAYHYSLRPAQQEETGNE